MINIKYFDPNQIKIDKKSYKNNIAYYIGYITSKNLSYVKSFIVNPLYLIINEINLYIEKSSGNKCLILLSTDKNKEKLKMYAGLRDKIKDLIGSITSSSVLC